MEFGIIFIHGANSSSVSFNYLKSRIQQHYKVGLVDYDSSRPITEVVPDIYRQIVNYSFNCPLFLVGHSLGGIMATLLSYWNVEDDNELNIVGNVCLSTPFAGSKAANYLRWLYPAYGLFDNVATTNPWMKLIADKGALVPTLAVITDGGDTPLITEPNDGVVGVKSQMSLKNADYVKFHLNHFEVLLSEEVGNEMNTFVTKRLSLV